MMDYKAKQDEWKQNFKGKYDHSYDGYVYLWPDGHRVIPSWITATFHDFLKANFPSDKIIRFHGADRGTSPRRKFAGYRPS